MIGLGVADAGAISVCDNNGEDVSGPSAVDGFPSDSGASAKVESGGAEATLKSVSRAIELPNIYPQQRIDAAENPTIIPVFLNTISSQKFFLSIKCLIDSETMSARDQRVKVLWKLY